MANKWKKKYKKLKKDYKILEDINARLTEKIVELKHPEFVAAQQSLIEAAKRVKDIFS